MLPDQWRLKEIYLFGYAKRISKVAGLALLSVIKKSVIQNQSQKNGFALWAICLPNS